MTSQISVEVGHDPSSRSIHATSHVGSFVGGVLEITNCSPFPIRERDEEIETDGANYQLEMMSI